MNEEIRIQLPAGYTERPAEFTDAESVTALLNTCSIENIGKPEWDVFMFVNDWSSPHFDMKNDSHIVLSPDGKLAAYIDIWDYSPHVRLKSIAAVHPQHRNKGIGSSLIQWAEWRANQIIAQAPPGSQVSRIQKISSNDKASINLLESNGYQPVRNICWMVIDLDQPPPEPDWPAGITIRTFDPLTDIPIIVATERESFQDHWGYVEGNFEDVLKEWEHFIKDNPKLDPSLWFLAVEKDEVVGICLCFEESTGDPDMGWLDTLAVRKPWRRRGIALALLRHSFSEMYRRGKKQASLDADTQNLTGAINLYTQAGMYMGHQKIVYEKILRSGHDLVKRS